MTTYTHHKQIIILQHKNKLLTFYEHMLVKSARMYLRLYRKLIINSLKLYKQHLKEVRSSSFRIFSIFQYKELIICEFGHQETDTNSSLKRVSFKKIFYKENLVSNTLSSLPILYIMYYITCFKKV